MFLRVNISMAKSEPNPQLIHNALRLLPSATFVLSCAHDKCKDGILTNWVQQCSTEPPMLIVAIPKGQQIEPMLRDSRAFGLCLVPPNDRRAQRLFSKAHEREEDPFLAIPTITAITGMPILPESRLWFDCRLEGHLSPEADCRLYLGRVVASYIAPSMQLADCIAPTTKHKRVVRVTAVTSASKTRK
jgi:flavin reductase (DIM6/NTAB) family NADH-FMN oxidoreductase RutF